jgi:mono/diheme cytochrome c family protein
MSRRSQGFAYPFLVVIPAIALATGGWAVITVDSLPDYVVAGRPFSLSFAVRQHGMKLLNGLAPSIVVKRSDVQTTYSAQPGTAEGHYAATLTLPTAGDWTVTVQSGFMNSVRTLLPITAVEMRGPMPPAMTDVERGRNLFVAKGCVTCHVNAKVNTTSDVPVGPDLTEKRYTAEYLARFLANPAAVLPPKPNAATMPTLGLSDREIASLVAFINADGQLSKK